MGSYANRSTDYEELRVDAHAVIDRESNRSLEQIGSLIVTGRVFLRIVEISTLNIILLGVEYSRYYDVSCSRKLRF